MAVLHRWQNVQGGPCPHTQCCGRPAAPHAQCPCHCQPSLTCRPLYRRHLYCRHLYCRHLYRRSRLGALELAAMSLKATGCCEQGSGWGRAPLLAPSPSRLPFLRRKPAHQRGAEAWLRAVLAVARSLITAPASCPACRPEPHPVVRRRRVCAGACRGGRRAQGGAGMTRMSCHHGRSCPPWLRTPPVSACC